MAEDTEYNNDNLVLPGFYRAKVIDNVDDQFFGRVKVWVPDVMQKVEETKGLWALPANNPVSGLNEEGDDQHYYSGSSYVLPIGSWCWVFFENGNPSRPFYLSGLNIKNVKILPECQLGGKPERKWVIYKSRYGRTIVISDDPDDERMELTGKKRKIKESPTGDLTSVYEIDDNQTTILHDERDGKQKVLIRTYKGDFIHVDIDERRLQIYFKDKFEIKTDNKIFLLAKDDVHFHTNKNYFVLTDNEIHIHGKQTIYIKSDQDINIKSAQNVNIESGMDTNIKAGMNVNIQAGMTINQKAGLQIASDGSPMIYENCGMSQPAQAANEPTDAQDAKPEGERDT